MGEANFYYFTCLNLLSKPLHTNAPLDKRIAPVAVKRPSVDQLFQGLLNEDRASLARSVTLVESTNPTRRAEAKQLLTKVLEHNAVHKTKTFRIGLTGPPGAGKSTFIEALGKILIEQNHKLAILA